MTTYNDRHTFVEFSANTPDLSKGPLLLDRYKRYQHHDNGAVTSTGIDAPLDKSLVCYNSTSRAAISYTFNPDTVGLSYSAYYIEVAFRTPTEVDSTNSKNCYIFDTSSIHCYLFLRDNLNYLRLRVGSSTNAIDVTDMVFTTNTDYHLLVVVNGTSLSLYVDGILKGTATASSLSFRDNYTCHINKTTRYTSAAHPLEHFYYLYLHNLSDATPSQHFLTTSWKNRSYPILEKSSIGIRRYYQEPLSNTVIPKPITSTLVGTITVEGEVPTRRIPSGFQVIAFKKENVPGTLVGTVPLKDGSFKINITSNINPSLGDYTVLAVDLQNTYNLEGFSNVSFKDNNS